jgi:hypothetical protein
VIEINKIKTDAPFVFIVIRSRPGLLAIRPSNASSGTARLLPATFLESVSFCDRSEISQGWRAKLIGSNVGLRLTPKPKCASKEGKRKFRGRLLVSGRLN